QCKRWWKFSPLARYACWLERVLDKALPEEAVALASLEFRNEPAAFEDRQVDRLHVDGSYIRSLYTLSGPATIYLDGPAELAVPQEHTLLLTAVDRERTRNVPATLHRRPGAGPERTVIVCSFEPRHEQPRVAAVYRRVAESYRSRHRG